jgi:hypothetical protein
MLYLKNKSNKSTLLFCYSMPERYPNPQSSSTIKTSKSSKVSKFEQFKSWIGTEQEANQAKNIRIAETGILSVPILFS